MRRFVVLSALLLALAPPAAAEDKVVRDQWLEKYQMGRKISWRHVRVTETAAGFVVEETTWTPIAGGKQTLEVEKTETDPKGKILGYLKTRTTPWGTSHIRVQTVGKALKYSEAIRKLAPREGEIKQASYDGAVLALLFARGALKPGKHTVRFLSFPGKGSVEKTFTFAKNQDGSGVWTSKDGSTHVYDAKGSKTSARSREFVSSAEWPATEQQARAPKRTRKTPSVPGLKGETFTSDGVSLTRPAEPGWQIACDRKDRQNPMTGMVYADEIGMIALPFPVAPPKDETRRAEIAKLLMKNEKGPRLSKPEMVEFQGSPAIRFTIGGKLDGQPISGRAVLTKGGLGGVIVMVMVPADVKEQLAPQAAAAWKAIQVKTAAQGFRRVALPSLGLSVEVPATWRQVQPGVFMHPGRLARVNLVRERKPDGMTLDQILEVWAAGFAKKLKKSKVTKKGAGTVGGRACRRVQVDGMLSTPGGTFPARAMGFVIDEGGGTMLDITLIGVELQFDLTLLDRIVNGVKFTKRAKPGGDGPR